MDILRPNGDSSTMNVIELIPMRPITTIPLTAGNKMSYHGFAHAEVVDREQSNIDKTDKETKHGVGGATSLSFTFAECLFFVS